MIGALGLVRMNQPARLLKRSKWSPSIEVVSQFMSEFHFNERGSIVLTSIWHNISAMICYAVFYGSFTRKWLSSSTNVELRSPLKR